MCQQCQIQYLKKKGWYPIKNKVGFFLLQYDHILRADMRKMIELPRAAFWGEKFPQKCMIHDCFQFMT